MSVLILIGGSLCGLRASELSEVKCVDIFR